MTSSSASLGSFPSGGAVDMAVCAAVVGAVVVDEHKRGRDELELSDAYYVSWLSADRETVTYENATEDHCRPILGLISLSKSAFSIRHHTAGRLLGASTGHGTRPVSQGLRKIWTRYISLPSTASSGQTCPHFPGKAQLTTRRTLPGLPLSLLSPECCLLLEQPPESRTLCYRAPSV